MSLYITCQIEDERSDDTEDEEEDEESNFSRRLQEEPQKEVEDFQHQQGQHALAPSSVF